MDLSIVIPAYEEEKRILVTLERSCTFLRERPWRAELLVVDDGSRDATASRVAAFAAAHSGEDVRVSCLANHRNRGKGYSIRRGMGQAAGRIVGFMDGDYKTDIAGLDLAVRLLGEGWDGVIGDRTLGDTRIERSRRRYRQLGAALFRGLLHGLVGLTDLQDTQCGFKFFQGDAGRDLFARQQVDGFMFDVEILMLAVRSGYRVTPIPVVWSDDADSRFRPLSGSVRNLAELARIRWRLRH